MRLVAVALLAGCASMPPSSPQTPTAPPAPSAETLRIRGVSPAGVPVDVLVQGSRIASVGPPDGNARPDLSGGTIVPALTDAHGHLIGLGLSLAEVDLRGCTSPDDCAARVRSSAARLSPGAWLQGRGWDQNLFPDRQFPTRATLDAAAPGVPIFVRRVDGHAGWASTEALRRAGITRETPDPPGGRIVRGTGGEPTGVLVDRAEALVEKAIPRPTEAELAAAILRAQDLLVSEGLTEVHEMGIEPVEADVYRRLARARRLRLRVYAHWSGTPATLEEAFRRGPERAGPDDLFALRAIKLYADGALGSRGARLKAPYEDDPGNRGLVLTPAREIEAIARRARAAGFQVSTHAIGDAANRDVLDAYAAAGVIPADRFRIEHAQIVDPADVPLFARLGVIASMQPTHATSDMPWAEARLGRARLAGAYAWRTFLNAGVPLAFGSDFPVELSDPRLGLVAAVTRADSDGRPPGGWLPEQRLSLSEALDGFTRGAAFAAFEEGWRGTLEPGRTADLTLFGEVLRSAADVREAHVLATLVAGRSVSAGSTR